MPPFYLQQTVIMILFVARPPSQIPVPSGSTRTFSDATFPKISMAELLKTLKKLAAGKKIVIRNDKTQLVRYIPENIELIGDVIQISISGIEK